MYRRVHYRVWTNDPDVVSAGGSLRMYYNWGDNNGGTLYSARGTGAGVGASLTMGRVPATPSDPLSAPRAPTPVAPGGGPAIGPGVPLGAPKIGGDGSDRLRVNPRRRERD